jgi:hypothetical protein
MREELKRLLAEKLVIDDPETERRVNPDIAPQLAVDQKESTL